MKSQGRKTMTLLRSDKKGRTTVGFVLSDGGGRSRENKREQVREKIVRDFAMDRVEQERTNGQRERASEREEGRE